jgi:sodium transport system permease protein
MNGWATMWRAIGVVFRKELKDALRDRRTLLMVLVSSVAMGPLVLALLSSLVSDQEKRAEAREVVAQGLAQAPTLANYLARQGFAVPTAPPDFEQQLQSSKLGDPVLVVVDADFEAALAQGRQPLVEIVTASGNQRAELGAARLMQLVQGFSQERALLRLAERGVSARLLRPLEVAERDLSSPASRAARLTGMLPFFVLMAVLYGALNAALDTTAGERERGSLEPLLMNPASRWALVVGKWASVASVAMLIAVLSCFSFLPGQWLLGSESLAALFQYGWQEALAFLALLLPLAGGLSAALMALAIRCKTVKEAQASATLLVFMVSLLPMMSLFSREGEQAWHLWVPALAQSTLMNRVLRGEPMGPLDLLVPALASVLLAVACLAWVTRRLRTLTAP